MATAGGRGLGLGVGTRLQRRTAMGRVYKQQYRRNRVWGLGKGWGYNKGKLQEQHQKKKGYCWGIGEMNQKNSSNRVKGRY